VNGSSRHTHPVGESAQLGDGSSPLPMEEHHDQVVDEGIEVNLLGPYLFSLQQGRDGSRVVAALRSTSRKVDQELTAPLQETCRQPIRVDPIRPVECRTAVAELH
jgi:hypothetical protein